MQIKQHAHLFAPGHHKILSKVGLDADYLFLDSPQSQGSHGYSIIKVSSQYRGRLWTMKVVDFRIFCIQLGTFVYLQYLQDRRLPVMSVSFICIANHPVVGSPPRGRHLLHLSAGIPLGIFWIQCIGINWCVQAARKSSLWTSYKAAVMAIVQLGGEQFHRCI